MGLQDTPNANRLHIGIFGKRNSGKSSLLNAITNQNVSMVSNIAGTTTDPVIKAMELHGIGPVVFYDTAGFDDEGELGAMRVEKTSEVVDKTDIAIMVFHDTDISREIEWCKEFKKKKIPVLYVYNQKDEIATKEVLNEITYILKERPLLINVKTKNNIAKIRENLIRLLPENYQEESIIGHLIDEQDIVLLVMPQDIQAPKGRLILPQVQIIRDLLDHKCIVQSCTTDTMEIALSALVKSPKLIITDSQIFKTVYEKKPHDSLLTSFSVLFAKYKGDIHYFMESAKMIHKLSENSHILIAEACTHAPLSEDIGRVKIPSLLRKRIGDKLSITMVSGTDFPEDISKYDLIIHCGACMFNKKHVLSRVEKAKEWNIPMTNYGVTIAYLHNVLDKIII